MLGGALTRLSLLWVGLTRSLTFDSNCALARLGVHLMLFSCKIILFIAKNQSIFRWTPTAHSRKNYTTSCRFIVCSGFTWASLFFKKVGCNLGIALINRWSSLRVPCTFCFPCQSLSGTTSNNTFLSLLIGPSGCSPKNHNLAWFRLGESVVWRKHYVFLYNRMGRML